MQYLDCPFSVISQHIYENRVTLLLTHCKVTVP